MRSSRRVTPSGPDTEAPSMTSMIDVVFLLLIFLLSFRVLEGRLDSQLPKGGAGPGDVADLIEPVDVRIEVDRGRPSGFLVHVWNRAVPIAELQSVVRGALSIDPETPVRVSTGTDVAYGHVVTVIDKVMGAGVTRVVFAG